MRGTLAERFWAKVDKKGPDECWEWQAAKRDGYGVIGGEYYGPILRAHRVSWDLANGSIPDGLCVLHHCDNPGCVNPRHLFLGTKADNIHDMMSKGRAVYVRGEANGGGGKLTESDVYEIRSFLHADYTQKSIAKIYMVSQTMISHINTGKEWGWLKEEEECSYAI